MKKMILKVSAIILTLTMLSTIQTSQQVVAAPKDDAKPDLETIEKLEKINQENQAEETQIPQYNENEYIVIKNKGISTQSFLNKIIKTAPKAKIRKQSLKEEAFGIAKKYKKQKQDIARRNAYKSKAKDKLVSIKTTAPTAAPQPTVSVTKDAAVVSGVSTDEPTEEDSSFSPTPSHAPVSPVETLAQEENMPVPKTTEAETAPATEKDDPSVNVKEVFLVEAEKSEIDAIKKMEDVVCVEQNIRVSAFGTNYIPWGVKAVGGEYAYSQNVKGTGVKVAVIDSGILQHPDLSITGGYNFIDDNDDYTDNQGHGTFVAGIINAQLDKMGITGIAPSADLYALKVVDDGLTGSLSDVIEGIYWCIENDMDIINMSFGTENNSQALQLAVKDAKSAGILMVASSGNGTEEITYPAKYDEVIAVGAIDNNYKAADFSAKGDKLEFVAPGADIYSTDKENTYSSKSGTSYSTAHVTGIAAGILSINTSKSAAFVRTLMKESARNLGDKKDYGYGMPDLRQAINTYDEFAKNFKDEKLDKDWTKPAFDYNKVKAEDDKIKLFDEPIWFEEARTVKSSPVPLPNNLKDSTYTISKNGAKQIKVHFKSINTESGYDIVTTNAGGKWSGNLTDITSGPTSLNAINVLVNTDGSVQSQGFEIDKIYYEPHDIPTAPFMATAKEDPDKAGNILLTWKPSYGSEGISKYEVYQIDAGRNLIKTQPQDFVQTDTKVTCSLVTNDTKTGYKQNSGYNQFVIVAYDKYGNYSEDSKTVDYDSFDSYAARLIVQQPMATGTPKVIAKYDNGTYATSAPNVPIDTKCEFVIDYYDAASAFIRVNEGYAYRNWENWTGGENTHNRVYTVPYTFRAKGSNKVKLELINAKGKLVSKTIDINVTDTSAVPAVPSFSKVGNEEYFYGQEGVNPATGNYSITSTDLEFTYPTMNESIVRTYNSKKTISGGFGRGWSMSLEGKIVQNGSQYRVYYGNGSEDVFILSGGKYVSTNSHNILETGTSAIGGVATAYRVVEPTGYTYGYNAAGYMVLFKQKYGEVYKITLDSSNRPTKFTGPSGRYADIAYNTDGLIASMIDDTSRYSKYYYNNKKQLTTRVSGSGRSTYYAYNSNGFLSNTYEQKETWKISDNITLRGDTVSYDSSYKVGTLKNEDDQTYSYSYNQAYNSDSGYAKVSRYTTLEDGGSVDNIAEYYKYNSQLNLIQQINELGERTYYDVNSYGDMTKVFDKLGNESYTEYDSNGNVIKTTSPTGYSRYYKYNANNDVICESDTNLTSANSNALYHNTAWSFYDTKGRLTKTVKTKKDETEFNNSNAASSYLDLFTIMTYKYQDVSNPVGYENQVIQVTERNAADNTKTTDTTYVVESGDMSCTVTTVSPLKGISRSFLNKFGFETKVYNADGTAEEMYIDNDGYNQRTISYGKYAGNTMYQVTGVTRDVIDLVGSTKQGLSDDEYEAGLDGLNFGTAKHVYVKNRYNDWVGARYKTSYSSYGPFSIKVDEELDGYGTTIKTYSNPDSLAIKTISDSLVENTTKYDKIGRVTDTWEKDGTNKKQQNSYIYSKVTKSQVYTGNEISAPNLEKTEEVAYNDSGTNKTVNIVDFDGKAIQSITTDGNKINDVINTYDIEGKLKSAVNVQENTTSYLTYDARGRVIKEETTFERVGSTTYMSKTETSYYEDNSVKEVKAIDSAKGEAETYQSAYYEYDNEGKVVLERVGDTSCYNYVQYVYDSLGNMCIQITGLNAKAKIKSGITDADLRKITFNPVESCDDTDYAFTRKIYNDDASQLRREVADDGSITEYETYDDFDQPKRVKSPNKNITEYIYDDQGRCINKTITAPSGLQTIETTDYYDIGKVINKVANTVYKEVSTIKDGNNAPVSTTKVFDNNSRLKDETAGNVKKEYEYDLEGKRTKFKISLNSQTRLNLSYAYDNFGLLQAVKNQNNTTLESYTYYSDGKLQSKVNPVVTTNYTYNLQGMITKLTAKKNSNNEIVYEENLDRNLNGQINKGTEKVGNITTNNIYDRVGRVTKVSDNLGKVDSYTYDDYHNINNKSVLDQKTGKEVNNGYFYNKTKWSGLSQTVYVNGTYSSMPIMGGAEYDENGNNTLDRLNAKSYLYNANNQMAFETTIGSTIYYDYTYDSQGLMYVSNQKSTNGHTNSKFGYVWDEDQMIMRTIDDSIIMNMYVRGNGLIGTINESGAMTNYYVANYRGDIVKILDASGNVTRTNRYDEFGNELSATTPGTGFGYAGEFYDGDSATIFLRARSYSPGNGRFIERDTYEGDEGSPTSRNLYTYCENDPVNATDPTGHSSSKQRTALFALKHPIKALAIGSVEDGSINISTNAVRFSTRIGLKEHKSHEGSEVNAFRHVLWSAYITKCYGKSIAKEVGDAHEENPDALKGYSRKDYKNILFDSRSDSDEFIDLANNIIGRRIGKYYRSYNRTADMKDISQSVLAEFHYYGLWCARVRPGCKTIYQMYKKKISYTRYNNAKKKLKKLDKNGRKVK